MTAPRPASVDPLFQHYPALAGELDRLCAVPPWQLTGASALVWQEGGLLLEISKPGHWGTHGGGVTHVGVGAIGGSLEPGETLLDCLQREGREELGTPLELLPADEAGICVDERTVTRLPLAPAAGHPVPCLVTMGANRLRRDAIDAPTLVIATFHARPAGPVRLDDLFGTLWLPGDRWRAIIEALPLPLDAVQCQPGVRLETRAPLPERSVLAPVWTVHTLQQVLRAGGMVGLPEGT
ncbi:MAG: NUDIX domain-containing protein [Chloroflexi bacterium]|nr:NUDIX domain-containing protein [Chloroflexota bacterium]